MGDFNAETTNTVIPDFCEHCEKYRNFNLFPGVEILWKGTVPA